MRVRYNNQTHHTRHGALTELEWLAEWFGLQHLDQAVLHLLEQNRVAGVSYLPPCSTEVLLLAALSPLITERPWNPDHLLGAPRSWELIRDSWHWRYKDERKNFPPTPPSSSQVDEFVHNIQKNPTWNTQLQDALTRVAAAQAHTLGILTPSNTAPAVDLPQHTAFGCDTVVYEGTPIRAGDNLPTMPTPTMLALTEWGAIVLGTEDAGSNPNNAAHALIDRVIRYAGPGLRAISYDGVFTGWATDYTATAPVGPDPADRGLHQVVAYSDITRRWNAWFSQHTRNPERAPLDDINARLFEMFSAACANNATTWGHWYRR